MQLVELPACEHTVPNPISAATCCTPGRLSPLITFTSTPKKRRLDDGVRDAFLIETCDLPR